MCPLSIYTLVGSGKWSRILYLRAVSKDVKSLCLPVCGSLKDYVCALLLHCRLLVLFLVFHEEKAETGS